jgi:hypothetical protein
MLVFEFRMLILGPFIGLAFCENGAETISQNSPDNIAVRQLLEGRGYLREIIKVLKVKIFKELVG